MYLANLLFVFNLGRRLCYLFVSFRAFKFESFQKFLISQCFFLKQKLQIDSEHVLCWLLFFTMFTITRTENMSYTYIILSAYFRCCYFRNANMINEWCKRLRRFIVSRVHSPFPISLSRMPYLSTSLSLSRSLS